MNNFEKTNSTLLSDLQAEIAKLQIDTQTCIKQIESNARNTANIKVESLSKEQLTELEYKKEWAILFPGLLEIPTACISQAPQQLAELRQRVEVEESRMAEYSELVQQMFDESVNAKWEDVNSARRRVSQLQQQHLRRMTEFDRVRLTIEKDKQKAVESSRRMAELIEYMKKANIHKRTENEKLKQEAKHLDEVIGNLASELNTLKSRASMDVPSNQG